MSECLLSARCCSLPAFVPHAMLCKLFGAEDRNFLPDALPYDATGVPVTCFTSKLATLPLIHTTVKRRVIGEGSLDVTNLCHEVVELFLGCRVFRGHLLVFGLPLIALVFEGLDFALVVAGFDVCLAESGVRMISLRSRLAK